MTESAEMPPPPAAATRATRPRLDRTGPDRGGLSGSNRTGTSPPPPPPASDGDVPHIVADTVKLGYEVIAENLKRGRAAADRYSAGRYHAEDASHDLAALGRRLLQLSRDLSTTGFDLIAAVLADPLLRDAVARHAVPPAEPPPPPKTAGPVPLSVVFRGPDAARGSSPPALLQQPAMPSILKPTPLYSSEASAPPLTQIVFAAPHVGVGVIVHVTVPAGHPAGSYSGLITDSAGHPLGSLTITLAS